MSDQEHANELAQEMLDAVEKEDIPAAEECLLKLREASMMPTVAALPTDASSRMGRITRAAHQGRSEWVGLGPGDRRLDARKSQGMMQGSQINTSLSLT